MTFGQMEGGGVVTGAVVVVGTLLVALGSQGPASYAGLDQEKSQKFPVVPEYMVI